MRIIILCITLLCFQAYGENEVFHSEFLSSYKQLPESIETADLKWRIGPAVLFNKNLVFQVPLLAELKMPFSTQNSHLRWLIQMGAGWTYSRSYSRVCNPFFIPDSSERPTLPEPPEPPEAPFDSDFFQENYQRGLKEDSTDYKRRLTNYNRRLKETTNEDTCPKKTKAETHLSFPHFVVQPGLSYDFGQLTGFLRGGVLLGGPKTFGIVASASLGSELWDVGVQTLYYDRLYLGVVLTVGSSLKKWHVKNPYKTDSQNIY